MSDLLTRRQFLKELGLAGAGVALAPLAAKGLPADYLNARADEESPTHTAQRPSWAKPSDKPTTEIDWTVMQRFDERKSARTGLAVYVGKEKADALSKAQGDNAARFLKDGRPGYTLKDVALQAASGTGASPQSFLGPEKVTTPADRGVPTWTGSPEEANSVVTAALRHLGAATVGVVELDPNTTEKLIYCNDPDGKELVFADVDQPAEEDKRRVIPRKARWVIVYTVQLSEETLKRAPTVLGTQTTNLTYTRNRNIQYRLQTFLRSLGYMAMGESSTNALGIAPAMAVMAGLGEMSRLNRLITPEYGPMVREFKLITDMPMAPTRPINAGILRYCETCKKCATACPVQALSMDDKPTWTVRGGWNNPGHKAFFEDSTRCREGWSRQGTNCGICFATCPYSSKDRALIHQFVWGVSASTPAMNGFFKAMHDATFGPPRPDGQPLKDPDKWWTLDLPEYGIDTRLGHKDG